MRSYTILTLFLCLALWASCSKDDSIDRGEISIEGLLASEGEELTLQPETRRNVLLRGGNGKFSASSEYSDIVAATIVHDTLRITAYREGETKVRVRSGDRTRTLLVRVGAPSLSFSRDEIHLLPGYESKQVRLTGGGEIVRIRLEDPSECVSVRWNATTSMVELKPHYEGVAVLYAIASDGTERRMTIRVRPEDSDSTLAPGFYRTNSRFYVKEINTRLIVQRHGKGIWLIDQMQPTSQATRLYVSHESLQGLEVGRQIELPIQFSPGRIYQGRFSSGTYPFAVESIDGERIVLLGKGRKLVLPTPKTS